MSKVVGIDLGTTNSLVAYVKDGVPQVIRDRTGDGLVPSVHARAFARAHPDAKVHVIDDCGHYPHIEFPARFNSLLRRWLDETAPAPQTRKPVTAVA